MTGYLGREIMPRLEKALRQLPVVVLSGWRQTGKSTLLRNEAVLCRWPNHPVARTGASRADRAWPWIAGAPCAVRVRVVGIGRVPDR